MLSSFFGSGSSEKCSGRASTHTGKCDATQKKNSPSTPSPNSSNLRLVRGFSPPASSSISSSTNLILSENKNVQHSSASSSSSLPVSSRLSSKQQHQHHPQAHTSKSFNMSSAQEIDGAAHRVSLSASPTSNFSTSPFAARYQNAGQSSKHLKPFNTEDVRILLLENVNQTAVDILKKQGYQVEFHKASLPEEELIEKIRCVLFFTLLHFPSLPLNPPGVTQCLEKLLRHPVWAAGNTPIRRDPSAGQPACTRSKFLPHRDGTNHIPAA